MSEQTFTISAWRRAVKVQEIILKAIAGEIKWIQAADILGVSPRTIRRKRQSYIDYGIDGLLDQRTFRPSKRRISYSIVKEVLTLYREEYFDFNVAHFHDKLIEDHNMSVSYTWVKDLLQKSGYVAKTNQGFWPFETRFSYLETRLSPRQAGTQKICALPDSPRSAILLANSGLDHESRETY